jgi:hypothetical protein
MYCAVPTKNIFGVDFDLAKILSWSFNSTKDSSVSMFLGFCKKERQNERQKDKKWDIEKKIQRYRETD